MIFSKGFKGKFARDISALERKVAIMEKEIEGLRRDVQLQWDFIKDRIPIEEDKLHKLLDEYVESHIYYTTTQSLSALEKGNRIAVALTELKELSEEKQSKRKVKKIKED